MYLYPDSLHHLQARIYLPAVAVAVAVAVAAVIEKRTQKWHAEVGQQKKWHSRAMAQGAATSKGYFNEVNLLSVPAREGLRTRAPLAVGRDRLQVFQSGAQKIYTARPGDA